MLDTHCGWVRHEIPLLTISPEKLIPFAPRNAACGLTLSQGAVESRTKKGNGSNIGKFPTNAMQGIALGPVLFNILVNDLKEESKQLVNEIHR